MPGTNRLFWKGTETNVGGWFSLTDRGTTDSFTSGDVLRKKSVWRTELGGELSNRKSKVFRFDVFMMCWSGMEVFRVDRSVGFLCVSLTEEKSFCINRNKQWALLDGNKAPNRTDKRTRHHCHLCLFLWIWGQIQQYNTTRPMFSPSLNPEAF